MKKAVLMISTFNSGSTAWAGALHRLGANLCPPFFQDKYEPRALVRMFDYWWHPKNTPSRERRLKVFGNWVDQQADEFVVKHPHLHLYAAELKEVLEQKGYQVELIHLVRHSPDKVKGLAKRKWVNDPKSTIIKANQSIKYLLFVFPPVKELKFNKLLTEPRAQLTELASYLGLTPTPEQMTKAVRFIKKPASQQDSGPAAPLPPVASTPVARLVANASGVQIKDIPPGKDRRITIEDVRRYCRANGITIVDPR